MKWVSENFKDLRALYVHQLRMLLFVEEHIIRAWPNLATMAHDPELREAFRTHVNESETHFKRLEQLLVETKSHDRAVESTGPVKCKAINALIAEADDMMQDSRDPLVRDAALIATAQRVEHYEIAVYGAVRHFARVLGESHAAEMLDQTIQEERHADHLLTSIAERVNVEAKHAHATMA